MIQHILVPLDGSTLAEAALPFASALANQLGASITLIHVIEKNAPKDIHGEHHLSNPDEACAYLDQLASKSLPQGIRVEQHVHTTEVSNVARSIVEHAGEFSPDLIVMCSHGSGGLRDLLVGNIAQQVIARGTTPVLLIHPQSDIPPVFRCRKLLVPMDGKTSHEHGLDIAVELGRAFQAELTLLFVVPTRGTLGGHQAATGMLLPSTMTALLDMNEQAALEYLSQQAARFGKIDVPIQKTVLRGDPSSAIAEFASREHADMIVLGTHGKSGTDAFWNGSVAPKLTGLTRIPLLFVPVSPAEKK